MYLRLLNGEENHAKEVAGRLKEKENMIYEKINTHLRIKAVGCWFGSFLVEELRMFVVIEQNY